MGLGYSQDAPYYYLFSYMWQKINLLFVQDTAKVQESCDSLAKDKTHIRTWVDRSATSKCNKHLINYHFNMSEIMRCNFNRCDDIHFM